MTQSKPTQAAKSLEGTYVFDDDLMDTPLQANHKLSSIQFIHMKQFHLNTLSDPCVIPFLFHLFVYMLVTRAYYIFQAGLELTMSASAS